MQSTHTRLKLPTGIRQKQRKHNDEPARSPVSSTLSSYYTHASKQEYPRVPDTPDLQFLKQMDTKQSQVSPKTRLTKLSNLSIHKSLDQVEIDSQVQDCPSPQYICPSHPNKKAKYFLQSNPKMYFCTKCALTIGQKHTLLDRQQFYKTQQIDKFRKMISIIKTTLTDREQDNDGIEAELKGVYTRSLQALNKEFDHMFQVLQSKRQSLVVQIEVKYKLLASCVETYKESLEGVSVAVERYLQDINFNYDSIVHQLDKQHFNQIMERYHHKIQDHLRKMQQPILETRPEATQINLKSVIAAVANLCLDKGGHSQKENRNYMNSVGCRDKPRTPNKGPI